jgi:hypothetical protein
MDYNAMPILRMEVEGVKAAILTYLGARGSELGDALSAEIDKAIAEYDWQGEVKRIVHATISEKINYYFKFGDGAKAVEDAVVEGFNSATGKGI